MLSLTGQLSSYKGSNYTSILHIIELICLTALVSIMPNYSTTYAPKNLSEVKGQEDAVKDVRYYIEKFPTTKHKALLLYGPSGTGKTGSAIAAAHDYDLEFVETNASDVLNKEQVNATFGAALKQGSLFGRRKLILIDEVDGISGQEDRGGMQALLELLEKGTYPVILTCTNPFDYSFNNLRKLCTLVAFEKIPVQAIHEHLRYICDKEGISFEEGALKQLARQSGGDMRGALTDLEIASIRGKITAAVLEELGFREQQDSMPNALTKILKTTDPKIAAEAFVRIEEDQDEQFLWLDKNIPAEYTKAEDLARAYDALSIADIYRRRIRRWQHWRFMVYINSFLTAGVACAKDEKDPHFAKYTPTGRLLKIWWANRKQEKKKKIAQKVAARTHTSTKRALQSTVAPLQTIFRKNKEMSGQLTSYFGFDEEEVAWLRGKDKE